MSVTEDWQSLVTAALVGADRQDVDLSKIDGPVGEALAHLDTSGSGSLLTAAAALSAYRRAGHLPDSGDHPAVSAAPAETVPVCAGRAEAYLSGLLNGDHHDLLVEYLTAVAAAGKRVPEFYLPALLDAGRRRTDLRPLLLAAGGERVRWLAAQNEDWAFADVGAMDSTVPENADDAWSSGSRPSRLALLASLRQSDPARARALVESTWKEEPAADRAAFVVCLETGLSADDEDFLELALMDRSLEVARAAVDLLASLPASRYGLRMAARASDAVRLARNLLRGWELQVIPPEEIDAGLKSDRVEEKSSNRLLGENAWILSQIVAGAPLRTWSRANGPSPADFVALAERNEWADALIIGLGTAVRRQPDPAWFAALLRSGGLEHNPELLNDLARIDCFPAIVHSLIEELLRDERDALWDGHKAFALLRAYKQPWSSDLSRLVIRSLALRLQRGVTEKTPVSQLHATLGEYALRMAPESASVAAAVHFDKAPAIAGWGTSIQRFVDTLQYRHDMHAAIRAGV